MKYNDIDKNITEIFRKNNIRHFAMVSLDSLPVKMEIKGIFGDVKSVCVFYLPHSRGFLNLKKRKASLVKGSDNNEYIDSIYLRLLKIIYAEIERISLEVSTYLESCGYESLPIPVRCIPGEEDMLPFSLIRIAQHAGLGGEGENRCLITPDYGPRVIMGAIVTSFISEGWDKGQIDPCKHCFKCADICPTGALTKARDKIYSWERCNMCSLCEIICPVGQTNQDNGELNAS